MTTDTVPKTSAVTVSIGGIPVTITGIAKGAGMIAPDMATLLAEGAALDIARAVANSPLVKTALFASDLNWGRILAAVGRAVSPDIDAEGLTLHLNGLCVFRDGARAMGLTEEDARAAMAVSEIVIAIDLGSGRHAATVWTCDLSYEYVRINAEYRS